MLDATASMICKVCANETGNTIFQTKEMMFGFKEPFNYLQCASCGVVQLQSIPANMAKYYPTDYYSYATKEATGFSFKNWRQGIAYQHFFGRPNLLGALVSIFSSKPPIWMKKKYLTLSSKILDVGAGSGKLLLEMNRGGFNNLMGSDPFLSSDIHYQCGVSILKKDFFDIAETFDFIMFHHSFEHMDAPEKVFQQIYKLLNKGSYALIRIPVADSSSFKKYGANWVNLDPPRHFFLHTTQSMQLLANKVGLNLTDIIYDSNQFQFYGSELYLKGFSLESYNKGEHPEMFSKKQMRAFRAEAHRLNKIKEGDWACFYLYKP
jgi:SAM-dependent methyltransferase